MKMLILLASALALTASPALADPKGKAKGVHKKSHAARVVTDYNRNGIADWREGWSDRNRNGIDDRREWSNARYGGADCPPGLAKKTPRCVPPGQVGKSFREGQRLSRNYRYYTDYDDIPLILRNRYALDEDRYRYIYRDDRIYVVDPTTRLITSILSAIL